MEILIIAFLLFVPILIHFRNKYKDETFTKPVNVETNIDEFKLKEFTEYTKRKENPHFDKPDNSSFKEVCKLIRLGKMDEDFFRYEIL